MKIHTILCDYAQVAEGKLNVIGGGWTFTNAGPMAMGIGVLIEVPWDSTNRGHTLAITLCDPQGSPVVGPAGPIESSVQFDVGRPPGHPSDVPLVVPFAMNVHGPVFDAGKRFAWHFTMDGNPCEECTLTFNTRPGEMRMAG